MHDTFFQALLGNRAPTPTGLTCWNKTDCSQRFAVYRNNVMSSLINVLVGNFPIVEQLVGSPFFRAMAKEYVMLFPPNLPIMVKYGHTFADFIADFPPTKTLPYLADIARLEFAIQNSRHAADVQPILLDQLIHRIEDEMLTYTALKLAPSVQLLSSEFAIASIWFAHQPQSTLQLSQISIHQPETLLLTRPSLEVDIHMVEPGMAVFIDHLIQGLSIGDAAEHASELSFDPVSAVQLLFKQHAISQLIDLPFSGATP